MRGLASDVDVDPRDKTSVWMALLALLRALALETQGYRVEVYRTQKGYHIVTNAPLRRWGEWGRIYLRDDLRRIEMDEERARHGLPTNVLFWGKGVKKEEVPVEEAIKNLSDMLFGGG